MSTLKTQKFKPNLNLVMLILLFGLILPDLTFSQTKKGDKIAWVKSTKNIVGDIAKTEVKKGDTLVVLHAGSEDPLLDSIESLRSHYHLIFYNYGVNKKVNVDDFERYRELLKLSRMNILTHSRDTRLAMKYLNEHPRQVKYIVFRGDNNPKTDYDKTKKEIPITKEQLIKSAEYGKLEEVKFLLKSGIDSNFGIGEYKTSPLHAATIMGHLDVVKLLIENDTEVNKVYSDYYTATPLWYTVNNGDLEIVKYLLENGADPMVENRDGWTPLRQANLHNHTEVIELLEKAIKNKN